MVFTRIRVLPGGAWPGLFFLACLSGCATTPSTKTVPAIDPHLTSPEKIMLTHDYDEHMPTKPGATIALTDARWLLTEIDGRPAPRGNADKAVDMTLTADGKIHGFAGCNQYMGTYRLDDGRLKIGPLASTRMACEHGMELERQFLKALRHGARLDINEQSLDVYDADGRVTLRFRASRLR